MTTVNLQFSTSHKTCLTLVGVGPGDPSLLTLGAVKAIQDSSLVSFPVSKEGEESLAASIASSWISEDKRILPLIFPMVSEIEPRIKAWRNAGEKLALEVANGEQVVFLCQGDVSLFATGSYLFFDIKSHYPKCPIRIIPGINSFSAAAACGHWPLSMQKEQLLVIPTPDNSETLKSILQESASYERIVVLLKLGNRWRWVRPLLEKMNLLENSLFAKRVGFPDQKVSKSNQISEFESTYFSLLIIRQNFPNFLSLKA